MSKGSLKKLAQETVEISKNGNYITNNKMIEFDTQNNTRLYREEDEIEKVLKNYNPNYFVLSEGTVDTIFRMSQYVEEKSIGVLNFASAYVPGGGFLNGAVAQEECLAYCSDLYVKQVTGDGFSYYDINDSSGNRFYTDTMFISPVVFFREGNFELVDFPVKCQVITCPAVNWNKLKKEDYSMVYSVMKKRMKKILELFAYSNCETIILGAFGCGVFGNSPEDVANIWYELLVQEEMGKNFKNVIFSILDRTNEKVDIFKRRFEKG